MDNNNYETLRYYYKNDIERIASHHIWDKLTVRSLHLSRKTIQSAYRNKKEHGFSGNIIDYLCYVCLCDFAIHAYLAYSLTESIKKTLIYLEILLDLNNELNNPIYRLILKDEKYLHEVFNKMEVKSEDELFISVKNLLVKRINESLVYKPKDSKENEKLNDG